jgi:hypothetical protein
VPGEAVLQLLGEEPQLLEVRCLPSGFSERQLKPVKGSAVGPTWALSKWNWGISAQPEPCSSNIKRMFPDYALRTASSHAMSAAIKLKERKWWLPDKAGTLPAWPLS